MTPNKPRGKHAPATKPDAESEAKTAQNDAESPAETVDDAQPTQVLEPVQTDGADNAGDLEATQMLTPVDENDVSNGEQSDEADDLEATQVLAPVDEGDASNDEQSVEADDADETDDEDEAEDADSDAQADGESEDEAEDVTEGEAEGEAEDEADADGADEDAEPAEESRGKSSRKSKGKHTRQAVAAAAAAAATAKVAADATSEVDDAAKTALITPAEATDGTKPIEELANQEQLQAQVEADRAAAFDALGSPDGPHGQGSVPFAPMIAQDESNFIATAIEQARAEKRRAHLKVAGITVGILVGLILIAYLAGIFVFSGRFLPNTTIGKHDVSLKTDAEVAALIDKTMEDFQLDVSGEGFSYRANGGDLKLSADSDDIVKAMHGNQESWQWPVLIFGTSHDETDLLQVKFSPTAYKDDVRQAVETFNESATAPTNATIVYNQVSGKFEIQPEVVGTQLDAQTVLEDIADAISELNGQVVLDEDNLLKPSVLSTDQKLIEAAEIATGMVSAKLSLNMGGMSIATVDGTSLSPFVTMNENYEIVFNDEELNKWVNDLAYGFDTIGTERYYTRADGKEIVVPAGGSYGWEVDSEALKTAIIDGIRAGQVADIEVPCVQDAYAYNGPNQRDWGNRYVDVDLSEQYVRFYGDDGSIIWESACISGSPDGVHDTVPGVWYVNNMESPSKLIGYENGKKIYETMVTYWMAFEGNGIGFHDATWQPGFGGSMFAEGYGSHGCVNLPYDAAQSLFSIVNIGDPVVVHF